MRVIDASTMYGGGTHLDRVLCDAVNLARTAGETVKVRFNGTTRRVTSATNVVTLSRRYFRVSKMKEQEYKRAQRKCNVQLTRKARRLLPLLPDFLRGWALNPDRFYGKRLSIVMAHDALMLARRHETLSAIAAAEPDSDATHSGMSWAMTRALACEFLEIEEMRRSLEQAAVRN